MRKLLRGIAEFRRTRRAGFAEHFRRLALGQTPDALLFACADSRVVPNLFASTEPGDLFVVRNVGNLVPPRQEGGGSDGSEAAAIEFAVGTLRVGDVIVCGHSGCGAMQALHDGRAPLGAPGLEAWIRHGREALRGLDDDLRPDPWRPLTDRLSQRSALLQIDHLRSHPAIARAVEAGALRLHVWWFDIAALDVLLFHEAEGRFVLIDEDRVRGLLGDEAP